MKGYVCIKCGKEAKWKSPVFISPLCDECAKEEADKLIAEKNSRFPLEVDDFFLHLAPEAECMIKKEDH